MKSPALPPILGCGIPLWLPSLCSPLRQDLCPLPHQPASRGPQPGRPISARSSPTKGLLLQTFGLPGGGPAELRLWDRCTGCAVGAGGTPRKAEAPQASDPKSPKSWALVYQTTSKRGLVHTALMPFPRPGVLNNSVHIEPVKLLQNQSLKSKMNKQNKLTTKSCLSHLTSWVTDFNSWVPGCPL